MFAEIDESFNIDPADIEHRITPRTKAIIACHLQGCPADMDPIMEIAAKHKIKVVEDCAQCAGGRYKGKYVGTIGDIGINSFQLSKTITAGEGGAVITNDPVLFERAMRFHDVGSIRSPYAESAERRPVGRVRRLQLPHERVHRRGAQGAAHEAGDDLSARAGQLPRKVREGVADLPGIKFRKTPDLEGDIGVGVFIEFDTAERRDNYLRAMRAEGFGAAGPGGSAVLPVDERIEKKVDDPSRSGLRSRRREGKEIEYGAACCPRTIDILDRAGGVMYGPEFHERGCAGHHQGDSQSLPSHHESMRIER